MAVSTVPMFPLVTDKFTSDEITVSANGTASATMDAAKAGYTPLGIINIQKSGTGNSAVAISAFRMSENSVGIGLANTASAARTLSVTATVLYRKN